MRQVFANAERARTWASVNEKLPGLRASTNDAQINYVSDKCVAPRIAQFVSNCAGSKLQCDLLVRVVRSVQERLSRRQLLRQR